jgi:hypothetical protein
VVRSIFVQISKIKIFISKFKTIFSKKIFQNFLNGTNQTFQSFSFLSSGMADSFQFQNEKISFQISKMKIQKKSFPCCGMANIFFQILKTKNFISNFKHDFFQFFHGGINQKKS